MNIIVIFTQTWDTVLNYIIKKVGSGNKYLYGTHHWDA